MTKRTRDFLFFIFIGVFIILTIIISLYASGYKISLSWPLKFNRLLQKTGMLIVGANPDGALIYLNNKPAQEFSIKLWQKNNLRTPNKIRDLIPGDYSLRLEKDGYWPFEKTIHIQPGQTTFSEEINLFRNDLPLLIFSTNTNNLSISPNNKYLYLADDRQLINLNDGLAEEIDPGETVAASATPGWQWTDGGSKLLIGGRLLDLIKKSQTDYQSLIGPDADLWQKNDLDRLCYRHKKSLSCLTANSSASELILSGAEYLTYQLRNDNLFFVAEQNDQKILQSYSFKNQTLGRKLILPASGEYRFFNDNSALVSLYDQKNHTLYLISSESSDRVEKIIPEVISWQWVNDRQLIYHNRWEIYWLDIDQAQASLINRVSQEITKIIWNNANDYLIFSTPRSLGTIDSKNGYLTTIFKTDRIGASALDQKNDTLYFTAQIGQQAGVYKMLLQ